MAARLTTYVVVGIVAATLIAGLIAGAQRDDYDGPVDLIVHSGRVFTADASGTIAEAIAVRGNQILRVGSNRDINRLKRPQTIVVDADGATVLPGFNDSHVHFISGGLALENVNLLGVSATEQIAERVRTWAETNAGASWVVGRGWATIDFPDTVQPREMLDEIVADRPVFLLSADGTAAWVNSRALELAHIGRRTPDPAKGTIVKDARTNEPTGVLRGAAVTLVASALPKPSRDDRARALRLAIEEAHRHGITSVQNADTAEADLELYEEARKAGDLRVRIHSALPLAAPLSEADLDRLDAVRTKYPDDPLFKVGALSIWIDGSTDAQAAVMLTPLPPRVPAPTIVPDDLNRTVRLADARGWQIMAHASGDGAVRMALDAYEHAARSNLASPRGRRHRIEHAETIDVADVRRFGALGVLASMQPVLGIPSAARLDARTRALGEERAARGWLYRSVTAGKGRLTFGSDWPAAPLNPLLGVHAAVTRTTPDGEPEGGWLPDERLTLKAALTAYTSASAWASFDEHRKGTLAPGMLADIVVLSKDVFDGPASALTSTAVNVTVFDGKIVYRRGANLKPKT